MRQKIYLSGTGCWPLMGATSPERTTVREWVCMVVKQVRKAVLLRIARVVGCLAAWWCSESRSLTTLCATESGEVFTHGDVVKAHVFLAVIALLMAIVG